MNKAAMWAVIAIVMAMVGALKRKGGHPGFGGGGSTSMGSSQEVKVKLTDDANGMCTIRPDNKPKKIKLSIRQEDHVEWQIQGGKCYAKDPDARVEIRFDKHPVPDPMPVIPERPKGRKSVVAQVNEKAEEKSYQYSLWLIPGPGNGEPYLLMDPELILEP